MASTTIGRLRVILGADSSELKKGLSQAKGQFAAISATFGAAAAAIGGLTRQIVSGANDIQRYAQVANAAPEEFQRWSAATSTVGIEQEKLADILKDVNDRVGDFLQTGGGPMADFFENIAPRVGVTAEEFARLSGPQALQLYVDSLEKAGVSQSEMTFYLEAMSSELTAMQPLLRNGGSEMDRLGGKAAEFGAVLSGDALVAMRRTQLALSEVGLVFKGFAYQIATAAAPALEGMARAFTALAAEGQPLNVAIRTLAENLGRLMTYAGTAVAAFGVRFVGAFAAARLATITLSGALATLRGALVRTGIGALVVGAGELVYQFTRLVGAAGGFGAAFSLVLEAGREAFHNMDILGQALSDGMKATAMTIAAGFLDGFDQVRVGFGKLVNWMLSSPILEALGLDLGQMAEDWVKGGDFGDLASRLRQDATDLFMTSADGFNAAIPSIQKIRDLMSDTSVVTDAATTSTNALVGALGGIDGAGGGGGQTKLSAFAQAVKGTRDEVQRLKYEMASLISAGSSANGVGDAMAYAQKRAELLTAALKSGMEVTPELERRVNALARAYAAAGHDAEEAADRLQAMEGQADRGADAISNMFGQLRDSSKSLKDVLADLLFQMAQFQFSKGATTLFGSGGPLSGVGSLLGGLIGENANGTDNWRGGWTMVGERGRELVNLPRGSEVFRNPETEAMMNGSGGTEPSIADKEFTMTDDGRIMARFRVVADQAAGRMASSIQKDMRHQPKGEWGLA